MDRRVDAHVARTQFKEITDRAIENHERFIVDRRGEPAVVIMSIREFINAVAPAPKWLQESWARAERRGLDKLAPQEIDDEIKAYRREKREKNEKK